MWPRCWRICGPTSSTSGPPAELDLLRWRHAKPVLRPVAGRHRRGPGASGRVRRRHRDHPRSQRDLRAGQVPRLPPARHQSVVDRRAEFQAAKLKALGRIHDGDEAIRAADMARAAGFENFNLDLMHGLPDQSLEDALSDLRTAIAQQPTHLSWYQLTLEPNTCSGASHRSCRKTTSSGTSGSRPGTARRARLSPVRDLRLCPAGPTGEAQPELLDLRRLPRHRCRRPCQAQPCRRPHPAQLEDPPAEGLSRSGQGLPRRREAADRGRAALRIPDECAAPHRRRAGRAVHSTHRAGAGCDRQATARRRGSGSAVQRSRPAGGDAQGQLFLNDLLQSFLP